MTEGLSRRDFLKKIIGGTVATGIAMDSASAHLYAGEQVSVPTVQEVIDKVLVFDQELETLSTEISSLKKEWLKFSKKHQKHFKTFSAHKPVSKGFIAVASGMVERVESYQHAVGNISYQIYVFMTEIGQDKHALYFIHKQSNVPIKLKDYDFAANYNVARISYQHLQQNVTLLQKNINMLVDDMFGKILPQQSVVEDGSDSLPS